MQPEALIDLVEAVQEIFESRGIRNVDVHIESDIPKKGKNRVRVNAGHFTYDLSILNGETERMVDSIRWQIENHL